LVSLDVLEKFARKPWKEILPDIVELKEVSKNLGGPSMTTLVHLA
jgi:hypothetical protein